MRIFDGERFISRVRGSSHFSGTTTGDDTPRTRSLTSSLGNPQAPAKYTRSEALGARGTGRPGSTPKSRSGLAKVTASTTHASDAWFRKTNSAPPSWVARMSILGLAISSMAWILRSSVALVSAASPSRIALAANVVSAFVAISWVSLVSVLIVRRFLSQITAEPTPAKTGTSACIQAGMPEISHSFNSSSPVGDGDSATPPGDCGGSQPTGEEPNSEEVMLTGENEGA